MAKFQISKELLEELLRTGVCILTEDGKEIPDPRPMEISPRMERPLTLQEQIDRVLRQRVSREAANQGHETFEEANDFDVEEIFDSPSFMSNYEIVEDEIPIMEPENLKPDTEEDENKDINTDKPPEEKPSEENVVSEVKVE